MHLLLALKVDPLALIELLVQAFPAVLQSVSEFSRSKNEQVDLRLGLHHGIHELELSLGNLDDLLDEARANLVFEFGNSVNLVSLSSFPKSTAKLTAQP